MCSNVYLVPKEELYHHGIKGMKWGVRRFQKKDGSLTPAGKKRYSEDIERTKKALDSARREMNLANAAYNDAYNKYTFVPTSKNYQEFVRTANEYKDTKKVYDKAKLNHDIAKYEANGGFDPDRKKSKHRQMLEDNFRAKGFNKKEAAVLADRRIRTEKVVIAATALTLTACAAYAANQRIKNKTDGIIKSGDLLQRIEMRDTGGKLNDVFYTSTGEHDNNRYFGMLGQTRKLQTGKSYVMQLQAQNDVKVASKDKAAKVFGELYKNDPDFRSNVERYVGAHFGGKNRVNTNNISDRNIRKMYENFNSSLVNMKRTDAPNKFYDKLKSEGYGAIQDINDMKYSGYNARNPLIVFDNSNNNIMVKSMRELTKDDRVGEKYTRELSKSLLEQIGKNAVSPTATVTTTGVAAAYLGQDYANYLNRRKVTSRQIERYKKQHPGTELSDKEIKKMLQKQGR